MIKFLKREIKKYVQYRKLVKGHVVKPYSYFWFTDWEAIKITFSKKYRDKIFYRDMSEVYYDFNNPEHTKEYKEQNKNIWKTFKNLFTLDSTVI